MYPNLTIDRSTISKILLQNDKWTAIINTEDSVKTFRHKAVKFPILDQVMNLWMENVIAESVILTDLLIKEKAKTFAQVFDIQENELVFSNGWLYKFKQRNNIRRYNIHGESESALLASLPEERTKLQQLLSRYTLDQIYNIDETISLTIYYIYIPLSFSYLLFYFLYLIRSFLSNVTKSNTFNQTSSR